MVLFGVYICIISLSVNSGYVHFVMGFSDNASILDCCFDSVRVMLLYCKLGGFKVAILLCQIIDSTYYSTLL